MGFASGGMSGRADTKRVLGCSRPFSEQAHPKRMPRNPIEGLGRGPGRDRAGHEAVLSARGQVTCSVMYGTLPGGLEAAREVFRARFLNQNFIELR